MTIITQFISRFRESLVLLVYILASLFLMTSRNHQIIEGLRTASLSFFGFFDDNLSGIGSYFSLEEQNRELRKQNTRLAYEKFQLEDALLENIRMRKLLQLKHQVDFNFIPAKVIGHSPQDIVTGFLLSTDDIHKVTKNAAVMSAEGLVGKVVKTTGKYAICDYLFDPNSRISVRVQRNRELSVISWDGGSGLYLNYIPNTIEIEIGDVIITSGMSQIYPSNIKVGVVTRFNKNEELLFQTVKVKPVVNFNRLEEVFILQAMERDGSGE